MTTVSINKNLSKNRIVLNPTTYVLTITTGVGTGAGAAHIIEDTGVAMPNEPGLNFVGFQVADNPGGNSTDVTLTAGVIATALGYVPANPANYERLGRTAMLNANLVGIATDSNICTTAPFTLPRTYTLPLANSVPAGWEITVQDEIGTITLVNTLTVLRSGGDTIDGAVNEVMNSAYTWRRFKSNGVDKWSFDKGVLRQKDIGVTVCSYSDIRLSDVRNRKIYAGINTDFTHSGDTNEFIMNPGLLIPGGIMGLNGKVMIESMWGKVGVAGTLQLKLYVNTIPNSLVGATQIAVNAGIAANILVIPFARRFVNKNDAAVNDVYPSGASGVVNDLGTINAGARTNVNFNTVGDMYIIPTGKLTNLNDTVRLDWFHAYLDNY